jgi:hypothetical protein
LKVLAENGKLSEIVKDNVGSLNENINSNNGNKNSSFKSYGSIFLQKPFAKKQRKK